MYHIPLRPWHEVHQMSPQPKLLQLYLQAEYLHCLRGQAGQYYAQFLGIIIWADSLPRTQWVTFTSSPCIIKLVLFQFIEHVIYSMLQIGRIQGDCSIRCHLSQVRLYSFFGQYLSRRHNQPIHQPPEGVYLLIITSSTLSLIFTRFY